VGDVTARAQARPAPAAREIHVSAFMLDADHIDYLLTAAVAWRLDYFHRPADELDVHVRVAPEAADTIGMRLLAENAASVSYRYRQHADLSADELGETAVFYAFRRVAAAEIIPVRVIKAVKCYAYQACEHPTWTTSEARAFCDALISEAIRRLPGWDEVSAWPYARTARP